MKGKEKEKGKRAVASGELRERKSYVVLCLCSRHRLLFFSVYYVYKYNCNKQEMLHCKKYTVSTSTKLSFEHI